MLSNSFSVIILCALAGFVIVWLVFTPQDRTKTKINGGSEGEPSSQNKHKPDSEPGRSYANNSSRPSWCDILLLDPDATDADIRKSYARLMKGLHPDVAGFDAGTSARCARVQSAYEEAQLHVRQRV